MTVPAIFKRLILRSLTQRGYVLLRKAEYDRMTSARTAPSDAAASHAATLPPAVYDEPASFSSAPLDSSAVPGPNASAIAPQPMSLPPAIALKEFATEPDLSNEFARA